MKYDDNVWLKNTYLLIFSTVIAVISQGKVVLAQQTTGFYLAQFNNIGPVVPPDNSPPELPPAQPLPPLEDLLESTPENPPNQQQPSDKNYLFEVQGFVIDNNNAYAIKDEEILELVKGYIGQSLTFADLLQIETLVTDLYKTRGYLNSGVVVIAQDVSNGIIKIRINEGKIENLGVKVNGRLEPEYIRSRLQRGVKTPFNINELQEALQLLQLNPLVENINAELSVGAKRDVWNLDVIVNQADAFKPVIFANNSRTPSVGSFQRGIEINHNNFAGGGDRFGFTYKNTEGSNDYDVSYNIPFNSLDGTVGLRYRYVTSDIIEEPFDSLDIESKTDEYQISIRQPIVVTASNNSTQEVAVGVEFSRQANKTTILNTPFPLSLGSNSQGETKISSLGFFQDWTRRTRTGVLAARSQFNVGLDIFDSNADNISPDDKFFSWRGQAQWIRILNKESKMNLLLRSDVQLSNSSLVPLEQFTLGGIESVRGYRQDALLGDNGLLLSAELRVPFYSWAEGKNTITVIPFADFGTVWSDQTIANQTEETLASLGLGLQLSLSNNLRARLDWGIPLVEIENRDRTLQEDGIYFSLEYLPF